MQPPHLPANPLATPCSLFEIAGLTSGKAAAKNKLETRSSRLLLYECHNIAATSFHRHYIFLNLTRLRLFFLCTSLSAIVLVRLFPILTIVLILSQELPVISCDIWFDLVKEIDYMARIIIIKINIVHLLPVFFSLQCTFFEYHIFA